MISEFFDSLQRFIQRFKSMMSYEGDGRQRESKKKIFPEQTLREKIEDRSYTANMKVKKSSVEQAIFDAQNDKIRQIEMLQHKNKELSRSLREEKQRYDQLFEQYEELIEKNSLIEKQYLNLKYQHNKEIKNLKKFYKEKIDEEIKKAVEDFCFKINEECLWDGLKGKIDKFISNLQRITEIFLSKSKKRNHNLPETNSDPFQRLSKSRVQQITSSLKSQKSSILQIPSELRIQISPNKDISKQSFEVISSTSNLPPKQVVFEDEYYGDIHDYDQLQQKIVLRKNYELMKNVNRNSSQIRRKKIFKTSKQFQ